MERLSRIARRLDASPLADWLALVAVILFVFGLAGLLDGAGQLVLAGRSGQ